MRADAPEFVVPPARLGFTPERTLEVAVRGVHMSKLRCEIDRHLGCVEGLRSQQWGRRAFDTPELIYLEGSPEALLAGVDVIWRWYRSLFPSQGEISMTIRAIGTEPVRLSGMPWGRAGRRLEAFKRWLRD